MPSTWPGLSWGQGCRISGPSSGHSLEQCTTSPGALATGTHQSRRGLRVLEPGLHPLASSLATWAPTCTEHGQDIFAPFPRIQGIQSSFPRKVLPHIELTSASCRFHRKTCFWSTSKPECVSFPFPTTTASACGHLPGPPAGALHRVNGVTA